MSDKQKTLICGDVRGNFNTLFNRVESVCKKSGQFDVLLCVGEFFGDDNSQLMAYKSGMKKVPVTTYVFGPSINDERFTCDEGNEILPNIVYMGKRGVFTTSSDIRIAYLSGSSRRELGAGGGFEPSDCSAVRDACLRGQGEYRGVDILLTGMWPAGVAHVDKDKVTIDSKYQSDLVSWLTMHVKPRYHFAPSPDVYYERQPYRNLSTHLDYRELATRFIALAPVGNPGKHKWLYACLLQPIARMRVTELLQATTDETECPFSAELLTQHQPGKVVKCTGNGQYFYDMEAPADDLGKKRRHHGDGDREKKRHNMDPDNCWFCLSSPSVEKHLVISVGQHCYLALAKGPLTPYHVLILPITHHQAVTQVSDEILEEINQFKTALRKMFQSMDHVVVFFERNFKTSHLQIQCVPLPKVCEHQILEVFQDEAGINSVQLDVLSGHAELAQLATVGMAYFHAELPTGEQLFARTKHNFPLQFGRDVLSSPPLLNCEDKADWRQCLLDREEEARCVLGFRQKFRPYDFTADDSDDSD